MTPLAQLTIRRESGRIMALSEQSASARGTASATDLQRARPFGQPVAERPHEASGIPPARLWRCYPEQPAGACRRSPVLAVGISLQRASRFAVSRRTDAPALL